MKNNLTKKEVREVPVLELAIRFNYLLEKAEIMPIKKITIADAREILWIEDELRARLIKLLGRDFYPPARIREPKPTKYMRALMKLTKAKPSIKFKAIIKSSVGTKIAEIVIPATTKKEADGKIQKEIGKLGLEKATYKFL